ncbi:(4Fe-4S)-binding protein [Winogradskyella ursingii]|uniref:(4Fe-4S)-binding protein n=1 Tax=Winogradskyella ursingii TaxID=2686079 RepID=UPI0015CC1CA0|nr:(4Fe-4S)-binding protein [Winogradskyella ursingii]
MGKIKEYSNGEVTVVWEAEKCVHSGICVKGLPNVFQPDNRPWIKIEAATNDQLVKQVKACPSGALTSYMNGDKDKPKTNFETRIEVMENGPLVFYGDVKVKHKDGSEESKQKTTAFCRCGASSNKPYCDGAHTNSGFKG